MKNATEFQKEKKAEKKKENTKKEIKTTESQNQGAKLSCIYLERELVKKLLHWVNKYQFTGGHFADRSIDKYEG